MFVGHFGVALAARPVARLNLGVLFVATQWLDVVYCVCLLAGAEVVRIHPDRPGPGAVEVVSAPWSHGVAAVAAWSALGTAVVLLASRGGGVVARWRAAATVAALIGSHGLLDAVRLSEVPPFAAAGAWPGVALETVLLVGGAGLYLRATRARDRLGRWGVPALTAGLAALNVYVALGNAPGSVPALALTNLATYAALAALAGRLDGHREPRGAV